MEGVYFRHIDLAIWRKIAKKFTKYRNRIPNAGCGYKSVASCEGNLGRPLEFFLGMPKEMRTRVIDELLERVELPRDYACRYSEEHSGGEK